MMPQLMAMQSAVRNSAAWRGGIEANEQDVANLDNRIEIGVDDFTVECMWFEQALEEPPQRHVVVTGNHQQGEVRQAVEEPPGFLELVTLGSLCQIAACHDGIGGERRNSLQQGLRDRRHEWRSEMQV